MATLGTNGALGTPTADPRPGASPPSSLGLSQGKRTGAPSASLHAGVRSHERQKTPEAPQARQEPPARAPGFRRRSDSVTLPGWQCPLCVTEGLGLTSPATVGSPRFKRTMEHTKRPKCHRYRTRLVLPHTQQAKRGHAEVSGRQRFTSKAATRGGRRTSLVCASPKARGWGVFGTKQQGSRGRGSVGEGDGVKVCHRVQACNKATGLCTVRNGALSAT